MKLPPITNFQKQCIEMINAAPRTHATHCFRSALYHLERAEALIPIDPTMAFFRAITAEEEAASGLMRCLMDLRYPGANRLNPHDHAHKHAVYPFMNIIGLFYSQPHFLKHFQKHSLRITEVEGETRLMLALELTLKGEKKLAFPKPPLNIELTNVDSGTAPDYSQQIDHFIKVKGMTTVKAFLKNEANRRNKILYAGPDGYPIIKLRGVNFLAERRARVFAMINLYLLLFPYKEHQLFMTHALSAFLSIISQLKRERRSEDEM